IVEERGDGLVLVGAVGQGDVRDAEQVRDVGDLGSLSLLLSVLLRREGKRLLEPFGESHRAVVSTGWRLETASRTACCPSSHGPRQEPHGSRRRSRHLKGGRLLIAYLGTRVDQVAESLRDLCHLDCCRFEDSSLFGQLDELREPPLSRRQIIDAQS